MREKTTELPLALNPNFPLRQGLIRSFRAMIEHAQSLGQDRVTKSSLRIYRKTIRRARALLVLCRPAISAEDYEVLRVKLRRAHQDTSLQRDKDMLIELLSKESDSIGIEAKAIAASLRKELKASKRSSTHDDRKALLTKSLASIQGTPLLFEKTLANDINWGHLAKGLSRTYKAARKAMNKTQEPDSIHQWRKRTKELNHQIEFLSSGVTGPLRDTQKIYANIAKQLGAITDYLALQVRLCESSLSIDDSKTLDSHIRKQIIKLQKPPRTLGANAFSIKPKHLAIALINQAQKLREVKETS